MKQKININKLYKRITLDELLYSEVQKILNIMKSSRYETLFCRKEEKSLRDQIIQQIKENKIIVIVRGIYGIDREKLIEALWEEESVW